jgi:hypothetical protein
MTTANTDGQKVTKALVREWMKRVREDLRDMDAALRGDDWSDVESYAMDLSGAGGEIANMASVRQGEADVTGSYR